MAANCEYEGRKNFESDGESVISTACIASKKVAWRFVYHLYRSIFILFICRRAESYKDVGMRTEYYITGISVLMN